MTFSRKSLVFRRRWTNTDTPPNLTKDAATSSVYLVVGDLGDHLRREVLSLDYQEINHDFQDKGPACSDSGCWRDGFRRAHVSPLLPSWARSFLSKRTLVTIVLPPTLSLTPPTSAFRVTHNGTSLGTGSSSGKKVIGGNGSPNHGGLLGGAAFGDDSFLVVLSSWTLLAYEN